uniref:Uncharacterized protein n=1 Tax=Glossina brevipalpis TaxID=37001 RepID=A0A1A9WBD9_9MUSC
MSNNNNNNNNILNTQAIVINLDLNLAPFTIQSRNKIRCIDASKPQRVIFVSAYLLRRLSDLPFGCFAIDGDDAHHYHDRHHHHHHGLSSVTDRRLCRNNITEANFFFFAGKEKGTN